jgi:hypothetical protein
MAKRVLRYTEEEFVTLLENIVKKVKTEEQKINESRNNRKKNLNERFKKIKEQNTLTEGLFGSCRGGKCDSNDDGQEIADKILSVIINNPEKVKDLNSKTFGNVNINNYETQYNFKIGGSSEITSRDHGNEKYDLFVGRYKIRCNSSTAKQIFKAVEKLDLGSRTNILRSLDM